MYITCNYKTYNILYVYINNICVICTSRESFRYTVYLFIYLHYSLDVYDSTSQNQLLFTFCPSNIHIIYAQIFVYILLFSFKHIQKFPLPFKPVVFIIIIIIFFFYKHDT
jgi:hypothetical protein